MSNIKRALDEQLQRVAVYGTLLQGFGNNRLLHDAQYLGATVLPGWEMYSLGGFPAITLPDGDEQPRIQVEIYEVNKDTLDRLDRLEGYPHFYDRMEVAYNLGDGEDLAWIYWIKNLHNWADARGVSQLPRIECGSWREFRYQRGA